MNQFLAHSSSQNLSSVSDGNKDRDPQPENIQRVKNIATLCPKLNVSTESHLLDLRELCASEGRKSVGGIRD